MDNALIIDVGMHNGDDTYYYLSKGYRVLSIEANPVLYANGLKRFRKEIDEQRLKILNVGISDNKGTFPFYVDKHRTQQSSFNRPDEINNRYEVLQIQTTPFDEILQPLEVPHYIKVDIEGYDKYCVNALDKNRLPQYFSCEATSLELLVKLHEVGYRKFKIIDQFFGHKALDLKVAASPLYKWYYFFRFSFLKYTRNIYKAEFPKGSSGPFGEKTAGSWISFNEAKDLYNGFFSKPGNQALNPYSTLDFHASL